jgi:hypothetical protein
VGGPAHSACSSRASATWNPPGRDHEPFDGLKSVSAVRRILRTFRCRTALWTVAMQVGHWRLDPIHWRCVCSSRLLSDIAPHLANVVYAHQPCNSVVAGTARLHMVGHRRCCAAREPTLYRCRVTHHRLWSARRGMRPSCYMSGATSIPVRNLSLAQLCCCVGLWPIAAWHRTVLGAGAGCTLCVRRLRYAGHAALLKTCATERLSQCLQLAATKLSSRVRRDIAISLASRALWLIQVVNCFRAFSKARVSSDTSGTSVAGVFCRARMGYAPCCAPRSGV